jgi:putative aldouronate transport system substrate-binding protein
METYLYIKKFNDGGSRMKKLVVFVLTISLMMGSLAGCAKKDSPAASSAPGSTAEVSAKGVLPITKQKTEITVFMPQSPTVTDYEKNKFTEFLEKETNIHVNWMLVPSKDVTQKLNVLLASGGKLPDVILGGVPNETLVEYASQGTFLPLNKYIEAQSQYFVKVMQDTPGLKEALTAPDGKIYSLQNVTKSVPNSYSRRMWINQKWLDNLGLKMPTTTQEFKDVLTAFKNNDPNKNGKKDEIPMMGATNGWNTWFDYFVMNSFIEYTNRDNPYNVVNGKITPAYDKDEFREGLRYMKSLVSEGLYDPVSFTQDINQLKQQFENEGAAIVGTVPSGGPNSFANMAGTRYKEYTAVPPLKGPGGVQLAGYNPFSYIMYANTFVITKDCKVPEAAFKWADYMYNYDVALRSRLGEPETDWVKADASQLDLEGKPALYTPILKWGTPQSSHWENWNPTIEDFADKGVRSDDPFELQRYLFEATNKSYKPYTPAVDTYIPPMIYNADDSKRLNEINTTLKAYIGESRDKFITGKLDLDKDWENYKNQLKKIGYEEVVKIMQARYDQVKK